MNMKMASQSVARRIHVFGITRRLHLHEVTLIPWWRAYSSRKVLMTDCRRSARTKQDIAGPPLTSSSVTSRPSTLDPTKFTQYDVLDLSGAGICVMNACGEKTPLLYKSFGSAVKSERVCVPFPPGTKGVFYFHDRTNVHPVAGDVRFRILPLDRVQDWKLVSCNQLFAKGEDLLDHNGFGPWHISLLSIMYKKRPILLELLKQCGYISQEAEMQVERLRLSVAARRKYVTGIYSQIIDSIADPFIIELSSYNEPMVFLQQEGITPHKLVPRQMTNVREHNPTHQKQIAYSGTVVVRFEMVRHEERNRIVLRVLKLLKPPNPSDVVRQEEGELLKTYDSRSKTEKTWTADSRTKFITPSSLKLLEERYLA